MKLGIIAAMDEELKILAEALQNLEKASHHGFIFYTGYIGRHDVVLVKSGIGKVMSAIAVALLVDKFAVDGIINSGSAGGVGDGLVVGDVVIADKLAYHDVDVTAFGYAFGQMAGQELYYQSSAYFVSELKKADPSAKVGLITSSDSFISSKAQQLLIKQRFPEVLAVEMEGASIAQAAKALGKPFVVIRSISDTADGQAAESFDAFIVAAGEKSAATLIKMLEMMV